MKPFYIHTSTLLTKLIFSLSILSGITTILCAQPRPTRQKENNIQFGFKSGATNAAITDLSKVLVSESYYTGYTFENNNSWGVTGGLFLNYKFDESISSLYSELSYSQLGNLLHYSDIYNFEYDLTLKYEFINWEMQYRAYIYKGLNIGIGPRISFNLTPTALFYQSNGEDQFGPDIRQQQQMRDVLKGRSNFSAGICLGYDFEFGLSIDARYYHGLSDIMETEVNNFNFIENKNSSRVMQVTLGYAIPYKFQFF